MSKIKLFLNNLKAFIKRLLNKAGIGGGTVNGYTELRVEHIRDGKVIGKRVVLDKLVTDAFTKDIVNALIGETTPYADFKNYKYHATGTGTTAENKADTKLKTEVGTRVEGTQAKGGTDNVYKSIATITYNSSNAITEHGLFNASTNGTLQDRTVFPALNVQNNDSIQFTYEISFLNNN